MDESARSTFFAQVFDLWLIPEIERRGLELKRNDVHKALVELPPGQAPRVSLNDEVLLVAKVAASKQVDQGEEVPVFAADTQNLRPAQIDADTAWVVFARFPDGEVVAFDFRRNRGRALKLVECGESFLTAAREAAKNGQVRPALESAYAAAEYAVMAQMYLQDDAPSPEHKARRDWLASWTGLGNAPDAHRTALECLVQLRPWARYGDETIRAPRPKEHLRLMDSVGDMLRHARDYVGELQPNVNPNDVPA